ncbi:MAG: isoprenylcysteine carboxylmethyltransferase family protein, partial [Deltaproteobacteria bacterium]|nr:isoprenylcysteine carboxylmethyltransferase family protein [Deltaproteobacteria bacterium]
AGSLLAVPGFPLLLGASAAFVPALVVLVLVFVRTAAEDRFLHGHLPGYADYASRVRWRLVPGVW